MRLRFGPPTGNASKGWPTFDKNGKRIRDEEPATKPAPRKRKAPAK